MADQNLVVRLSAKNDLSGPVQAAGKSVEEFKDKVTSLGSKLAKLAGVLGTGLTFAGIIREGFQFNAQMESGKLAITGLVQTFMQANGAAVTFERATKEAEMAQRGLRQAALETAFELKDLADAFQTIFPAAVQAGMDTKQVLNFTKAVAQLAAGMNLPLQEVSGQISLILAGVVRAEGKVGLLFKNAGVTAETLASWRAAGTTFENLFKIIAPMAALAPKVAETWAAAFSNMKDAGKQLVGEGLGAAFGVAKKAVLDFTETLVTIKDGKFTFNPDLLAGVKELGKGLGEIIKAFVPFLSAFLSFGVAAIKALAPVAGLVAGLLIGLTGLLKAATPLVDTFGFVAVAVWGAVKATNALTLATTAFYAATQGGAAGKAAGLALAGAAPQIAAEAGITALFANVAKRQAGALGEWWGYGKTDRPFMSTQTNPEFDEGQKREQMAATLGKAAFGKGVTADQAMNLLSLAKAIKEYRTEIGAGTDALHGLAAAQMKVRAEAALAAKEAPLDLEAVKKWEAEILKFSGEIRASKLTGPAAQIETTRSGWDVEKKKLESERDLEKNSTMKGLITDTIAKGEAAAAAKIGAIRRQYVLDQAKTAAELREGAMQAADALLEGGDKELAGLTEKRLKIEEDYKLEVLAAKTMGDFRAQAEKDAGAKRLNAITETNNAEKLLREQANREAEKQIRDNGIEILKLRGMDEEAEIRSIEAKYADELERIRLLGGKVTEERKKQLQDQAAAMQSEGLQGANLNLDIKYDVIAGDWADLFKKIGATTAKGVDDVRARTQKAIADIMRLGTTAEAGIMAGLLTLKNQLPTAVEMVSQSVVSIGNSLQGALDDGFFSLITGKLDGVTEAFRKFGEDILRTISKAFSQIVMNWILTGNAISDHPLQAGVEGGGGTGSQAGSGGGGVMGLLGGLFKGQSGASGYQPNAYDYTGSTGYDAPQGGGGGAGMGQYAGWAGVVAGVGMGLVGAFKKNRQEVTYQGTSLGNMDFGGDSFGTKFAPWATAAVSALAVPVLGWIGAAVIAVVGAVVSLFGGPKEGHVFTSIEEGLKKKGGPLAQYVAATIDSQNNALADLFLKGAPDSAASLLKSSKEWFKKVFGNARFDIAAGSGEDISKDIDFLLKKAIPKMQLQAAFGQIGYAAPGNRDAQGGMAGIDWNANNAFMDAEGNWIKKQLFDPEAPIPTMLSGLGVTADGIKVIAQKLADTNDIEAFKTWLTDWIGVLQSFDEVQKKANRTFAEMMADATKALDSTAYDTLAGQAKDLSTAFQDLSLYSGDDATKRAKEVLAGADTFFQNLQEYLKNLISLGRQIAEAGKAARESFVNRIADAEDPSGREARLRKAVMNGGPTQQFQIDLANAKTPDEVQKIFSTASAALSDLLDVLLARQAALKEAKKNGEDLLKLLNGDRWAQANPAAASEGQTSIDFLANLETKKNEMFQLSGDAQIAKIREIQQMVADRYAYELQQLHQIKVNLDALSQSVQDMKFGWDLEGAKSPAEKGAMLTGKIQDLMGQIGSAGSAEEVKKLTDQIQALIGQSYGLIDPNSPDRNAAVDELKKMLDEMEKVAKAKYEGLKNQVTTPDGKTKDVVQTAQDILAAQITTTATDIGTITANLDALIAAAGLRITTFEQDAAALGATIAQDVRDASKAFTDALTEDSKEIDTARTRVRDFGQDIQDARDPVQKLAAAVTDATNAINAATIGIGGTPGGGNVIPALRSNPGILATATGY